MDEAENAMCRLTAMIELVLAQNRDISLRLRNLDPQSLDEDTSTTIANDAASYTSSPTTPTNNVEPIKSEGVQRNVLGFAFEEQLFASKVYRKPLFSRSGESLKTSSARTTGSSILSGFSLTDISNISVLAVPIYAHEISNSERYQFGDYDSIDFQEPRVVSPPMQSDQTGPNSKQSRWRDFIKSVRQPRSEVKETVASQQRILGAPLEESIKYANVAINLTDESGQPHLYGYVPIIVAKAGVFLKEKGSGFPSFSNEIHANQVCLY